MPNGVWRISVVAAGAAALGAAAAAPEAPPAAETAQAPRPVNIVASDLPQGGQILLSWPDLGGAEAPPVRASVEGTTLVIRADTPMSLNLARFAADAPAAFRSAAAADEGRTIRVEMRRPMEVAVAKIPGGVALNLVAAAEPQRNVAQVSAAETAGFTRLSFRFPAPVTVTPLQTGPRLELRFSRGADLDVAPLSVDPPKHLRSARVVSKAGERLAVALELEPGVRQRHFVEGSVAVVDLLPPREAGASPSVAAPPPPAAPTVVAAASRPPPGGVVRAQVAEAPDATTFTFRWPGPARAAAFRRGDAIWLLFDADARIALDGTPRVGRRYGDLTPVKGEGVTGLRISTRSEMQISARAQGPAWVFSLSERADAGAARVAPQRDQAAAGVRLSAPFGRDGVVRFVDDPIVGDRFAVGLLPGPSLGVGARRGTLEATLLPTSHGAAAELKADGVGAVFENGVFAVSRGQGLIASSAVRRPLTETPDDEALVPRAGYAMLDFNEWAKTPDQTPRDVLDELHRRVAEEGTEPGAPTTARIALARFLLASDLAPEALGALRVAAVNQPQLAVDPEYRLMRAAASLMMGRLADAQKDLSASGLAEDATAALWRGYAAALAENWPEARRNIEAGRSALSTQPPGWRTRFLLGGAEAALQLQDIPGAEADVAAAIGMANTPALRAQAQVLNARIVRAKGDTANALRLFDELSRSRDEASAVRASLEAIRLRRELKQIQPEAAADALDALRFRWRGDALELETIQTLAFVYADLGRWRDGLTIMRQAAMRFGDHPAARRLRLDMAEMFESLYLGGGADKLDPIQALGLFYDFKDLTPYGPDGDRMVRLLASRLAAMDLMEQAAELLQHQVSERLEGIGQAQIAADLAALYLADNRPEQAIAALQSTRQPRLPTDLVAERRILEASALMRLGRFDHALELLEKDQSRDAQRVRAEVAWRQKDWPTAAREIEKLLATRRPPDGPLEPEDRDAVIRLAITQVFAGDREALAATRRKYLSRMQGTPEEESFDVVTETPDPGSGDISEAVRRLARTDLLDRFMKRMREGPAAPPPATPPAAPPQSPPTPAA